MGVPIDDNIVIRGEQKFELDEGGGFNPDSLSDSTNTPADADNIITSESGTWYKKAFSKVWDYIKTKIGISAQGSTGKYLDEQGNFTTPPDTTYEVVSKTANGLAPQLPNETTTTKYLRQDGTWEVPPDTTYSAVTPTKGSSDVSLSLSDERWYNYYSRNVASDWVSTMAYSKDTIVKHKKNYYRANAATNAGDEPSVSAKWTNDGSYYASQKIATTNALNASLANKINNTGDASIAGTLAANILYLNDTINAAYLNIDTINYSHAYIMRIITGSGSLGTQPTTVLGGNAYILIGFSAMTNNKPNFGVQLAIGFGSNKIAIRNATYNASGGSWSAWRAI